MRVVCLKYGCVITLMLMANMVYALPFNINVTPNTTLPTTIFPGTSLPAYYTVQNNTLAARPSNFVMWLPPNVTQIVDGTPGSCGRTFNLAPKNRPGDSCILQLSVNGPVDASDKDPHHHLFVCFPGGITCAGPLNHLNVTEFTANRLTIATADSSNTTVTPFTSINNGNTWTTRQSVTISDAEPGSLLAFFGVACDSSIKNCIAAGTADNSVIEQAVFGIHSNNGGITWSTSTFEPVTFNITGTGAFCGSTGQHCLLMAYSSDVAPADNPYCYVTTNYGATWSIHQLPAIPTSFNHDRPVAVACNTTAQRCTTVGDYSRPSDSVVVPLSYITNDGGNNWNISNTMPQPVSIFNHTLYGVACSSNGLRCVTVGEVSGIGITIPISYTSIDGGNNWSPSATVFTPIGNNNNILYSVTCDTTGQRCVSVGVFRNLGGGYQPLSYISTNGGVDWTLSNTLPPPVAGAFASTIYSVTCDPSITFCTAVGIANLLNSFPLTYVSFDGGNNWQFSSQFPQPEFADTYQLFSVAGGSPSSSYWE